MKPDFRKSETWPGTYGYIEMCPVFSLGVLIILKYMLNNFSIKPINATFLYFKCIFNNFYATFNYFHYANYKVSDVYTFIDT